jgi:hypothetical protein
MVKQKYSRGQHPVNITQVGNLVILVNMHMVPLIILSIVKVYQDIINPSTHWLHKFPSVSYVETSKTSNSLHLFHYHVSYVSRLCCNN